MSVETKGPRFLSLTTRLRFAEARNVAAEAQGQILQLALAALIADRTIERMIDEQKFHGGALRRHRLGRFA